MYSVRKKIVLLALLGLVSVGCQGLQRQNIRTSPVPAQNSRDVKTPVKTPPMGVQTTPATCTSDNSVYSVFNECKDYNPIDAIDIKTLNERFPVVDSEVAFLKDGGDFFAARWHLLNSAKTSVKIQSLTFTNDEASALLVNKLIELRKRGLSVSIIVDAVHNLSVPEQEMYFKLQRNGIEVEGFQFLYLNFVDKALKLDAFGLTVGELNMRYHEKLFIVDGESPERGQAIIGGANIANRYFQVQHEEPEFMWRDRDVLVRGPVVRVMSSSFDQNFAEKVENRKSNLISSGNFWWSLVSGFLKDEKPYDLTKRNQLLLGRLQNYIEAAFNPQWKSVQTRFIKSRPRFREDLIHPLYISMIADSTKSIKILNSYFLPDESFIIALRDAVHRGVRVELITNHAKNTDFEQLTLLTRSYYIDLLSLNETLAEPLVFIHEWSGDKVLGNGEGQNHAKFAVFDDQVAIVGSYNLDPRSHKLNSESVIVFKGDEAAVPYSTEFDEFAGPEYSVAVDLETAQQFERDRSLRDTFELKILEILKPFL